MAENQIVVELILDDGQVLKALGKIKQEAKETQDDLEKNSNGGGVFSKKLGDLTVGIVAFGVAAKKTFDFLADGLAASVASARQSQKAIDDLSAALAVNGKYTDQAIKNFENFASVLSQQTGVDDDLITQNASLLSSLGGLSGEGLERATKAALDLAAATGKDVSSAFRIVSLAAEGNTTSLSKLGIVVDQNAPKAEKFAQALDQLNKKFGGLAEARAEGFEGNVNRLANAFDDLLKAFGNVIVKSPLAIKILKEASTFLSTLAEKITSAFAGKDLFGDFIRSSITVAKYINSYLVMPLEIFFRLAVAGVGTLAAAVLGLNLVFLQVKNFFIENLAKPIFDFFANQVSGLVGVFNKTLGEDLKEGLTGFSSWITEISQQNAEVVGSAYESVLGTAIDSANSAFDTSGSAAIDALLDKAEIAADIATTTSNNLKMISDQNQSEIIANGLTLGQAFSETLSGLSNSVKEFADNGAENFKRIGAAMFNAIGNAAGQAFGAFGKALANGENAIGAFLNSLLASFGQMAIQLGTQFMLQGAAYMWAGMPNGGALIAAGAALATFGGVLSALGGGGAGASAGASASGGGVGVAGSVDSPIAQIQQPEAPAPQDKITVNIQGDVLDSDETSSRIVRLLSDYADRNGNGAVVV